MDDARHDPAEVLARSTRLTEAVGDLPEIWLMDPADLDPDPRNPMTHSDAHIQRLTHSISTHGNLQPVVWNRRVGQTVGGHGRIEAALLAHRQRIHVMVIDVDPDDQTAINLALNGTYGEFDSDALASVVADLAAKSYPLDNTGLEPYRLDELLSQVSASDGGNGAAPHGDPDAIPPPPPPVSKRGDLWLLGRHRLLVADSTEHTAMERLMDGQTAGLMVTDPPYGVDYAGLVASRKNQKKGGWPGMESDAADDDALQALLTGALGGCGALIAFVWHPAGARRFLFWDALEANGWRVAQEIVWVKNALVFGRADYQWRHEPCMYAKKAGAPQQQDRTETTVWEIPKPTSSEHPTQKPVELFARAIRNHTAPGDIVYDPFLGSGTAIIAAEQEGRAGRGMEIEPRWADVACARFQRYTDILPILEATGEQVDFLAAAPSTRTAAEVPA